MKKGFSEGFQGYCLSNRELALGCNSSLPYRQLRNCEQNDDVISRRSLPYRQLRKQGILNPF